MSKSRKQKEHLRDSEVDTFENNVNDSRETHRNPEEDEQNEQELLDQEVDDRGDEITGLQREIAQLQDKLLRKAAEFENMRKRTERERLQVYETARIEALRELLPVNDDLKRTLEAADSSKVDSIFLEGIKMVSNKFDGVLARYGVERIDKVNIPFDVDLHDAMMKQKAESNVESNTVLTILEPGYKMNDRVIRHAKVIVSE